MTKIIIVVSFCFYSTEIRENLNFTNNKALNYVLDCYVLRDFKNDLQI
jgi:hypothetical protein